MKLHYITHSQIDIARYDKCIEHSVNGSIFAQSWYLNAVSQHWDILVDEHYKCVMPLPYILKQGKKHLTQPVFCSQLGIYSNYLLLPSIFTSFYCQLEGMFASSYLIMNKMNSFTNQTDKNYSTTFFWEKDIIEPYSKQISRYKNSMLLQLTDSQSSSLTIKTNVEFSELIHFWALNPKMESYPYSEYNINIIKQLESELLDRNLVNIIAVYNSAQQIICISLWVWSRNHICLLFFASTDKGVEAKGITHIIEHLIQKNSEKALTLSLPSWISDYEPDMLLQGFNKFDCPIIEFNEKRISFFNKIKNLI